MPFSSKYDSFASVMYCGMIDERCTGFGTPYKFNGKELDCESGYYYYVNELVEDIEMSSERVKRSTSPAVPSIRDEERMRSRYYDPRMSRFLSVDPLASDMPAWGSYTYTFDNPIRLVDPTGMRPEECPTCPENAGEGDTHDWAGETFRYSDGEWGTDLPEVKVTAKKGDYAEGNTPSLTRAIGQISFTAGISGEAMKLSNSSFRLRTSTKLFSPKLYPSGWGGNKYTSTFRLSGVGQALGVFGFAASFGADYYGYRQYQMHGPSHPNAISPRKFGLNTTIGLYGLSGTLGGATFSSIYFGFEAFYPGGFGQTLQDKATRDAGTFKNLGRPFNSMNLGTYSPFKQ